MVLRGGAAAARRALDVADISWPKRPVLVNGAAGVVVTHNSQAVAVMGFIVADGRITEIDIILDPDRVGRFDLSALDA